eukprot:CAMPEP_0116847742 /NCGR_PEP_ID=MMETSP0418-20121206/14601_1 /TAXON_ID=1158023 /ORGANISM="Astrosyne radiata, Strain 13vi08-1A" /LENGTH=406 /DNA_ID=CAMNT_0004479217 /DNA_START=40 /DNA_END=1261 /DNA_ORIENTATION=+
MKVTVSQSRTENNSVGDDLAVIIDRLQYEPLDQKIADRIVRRSKKEVDKLCEKIPEQRPIPPFHLKEIELGPTLGVGGFSRVHVVDGFNLSKDESKKFTAEEQAMRQAMADTMDPTKNPPKDLYAVKHLRQSLVAKPGRFYNGAVDLALEAAFLSSLNHPNILKIKGISAGGHEGFASGRHDGYFLVLECLDETLRHRIIYWRKKAKRLSHGFFGLVDKKGKKRLRLLMDRLKVAQDVASALAYMHEKGLIARDVKPCNIGFDMEGTVKLIDFGLVRAMPTDAETLDEAFKMTGGVGTLRYMAPEVRRKQPYNQKADVYSFGMVLLEILSLNQPEYSQEENEYVKQVPCQCWPEPLRQLVIRTTTEDMTKRPTMAEVRDELIQQVAVCAVEAGSGGGSLDEVLTIH